MLDLIKYLLHKVLPADNPGIGKIPASVPEALYTGDLVALFPGLLHNFFFNGLAFARIHCACFIDELPLLAYNLFGVQLVPFLEPKINVQQAVFIAGLGMVAKRTPSVVLRFFHNTGTDRV